MQYTEFYQFRKPTKALDVVKVGDINYNSDLMDELIHSTQISLAPAYDETRTSADPYNTGDVVMKDALMYKCKEDGIYGAWDATKWERTTAGEEGAGGSDVEANPQGTPTDDLEKIGINGTIYNIAGSGGGGGNVYGAFVDTNRVITTLTGSGSGDTFQDYTAVEDCAVIGTIRGDSGAVQIDGATVAYTSDSSETIGVCVYARRGQTVSYRMNSSSTLTVYGLTFGTQNIFTPQIYSTKEECVGAWIDNKPLYCKTFPITATVITTSGVSIPSIDISGMDNIIRAEGVSNNKQETPLMAYNSNGLKVTSPQAIEIDNVVLWYTKTTDTAGSGSYNTLGVPMVHIEDDVEYIIGTYNGETLYRKRYKFTNPSAGDQMHPYNITGSIKEIVNFYGVWHRDMTSAGNGLWAYQINAENEISTQDQFRVLARPRKENGVEGIYTYYATSGAYSGAVADICVTIEYTKSSS